MWNTWCRQGWLLSPLSSLQSDLQPVPEGLPQTSWGCSRGGKSPIQAEERITWALPLEGRKSRSSVLALLCFPGWEAGRCWPFCPLKGMSNTDIAWGRTCLVKISLGSTQEWKRMQVKHWGWKIQSGVERDINKVLSKGPQDRHFLQSLEFGTMPFPSEIGDRFYIKSKQPDPA